ncbi:MAG: hypothetical protein KatS3mg015_2352 [Fimbriimonadales bacterium]|nr:MAG: hypothetical protein KatS3mg015_2352 [Fimbriimonadales bacterium]
MKDLREQIRPRIHRTLSMAAVAGCIGILMAPLYAPANPEDPFCLPGTTPTTCINNGCLSPNVCMRSGSNVCICIAP